MSAQFYTINQIIKNIGNRIGLPDITVHCFRRWLASDLNKKGVDPTIIQDILGHSSFETTQKHYLAKSYDKISYIDILNKDLKVMDSTATSLCRDNHMPLLVFAISEPENIVKAVKGEKIGTIVK